MVCVGCDFGLNKTGIVVLDEEYKIRSQNLVEAGDNVKGAERLVVIENAFQAILDEIENEEIVLFLEGYAYGAKWQRESLAELGGVIRRCLFLRKQDFWAIPPTKVKKFATGHGGANKNFVKKCTREKWNEAFKSDDVCDAYCIARIGMTVTKVQRGLQDYPKLKEEQQVIQEIIEDSDDYKNRNTAGRNKSQNGRKRKTARKQ